MAKGSLAVLTLAIDIDTPALHHEQGYVSVSKLTNRAEIVQTRIRIHHRWVLLAHHLLDLEAN